MSEIQRLYRALKASAISCQAEAEEFRVTPDCEWGEVESNYSATGKARRARFCTRISRDSRNANNGGDYFFWDVYSLGEDNVDVHVSASCDFWQPDDSDEFRVCLSEKGFNFLCWLAWQRATAERRLAKKQKAGAFRPAAV